MPPSDYLATYRLSGFNPRLHLSVYQPAVAASGALSSTPSNNTTSIAVSFAVGSETDVEAGFQIVFTDTATGIYKGESRIRFTGSITSSSLPIRELAQGTASLASGDTFTVYRFVPLDSKLVASDASFAPDGIPYADQGSNPPPLIASGGHWAGWVDSGATFATITTDGSNSSLVDPDSSSGIDHLWSRPSGVALKTGSADTDTSPVFETNQGHYLARHRGTDQDNSKAAYQYVAYVVHDATHPPYEVLLTALDGDTESGVSFTVELMGQAGVASDAFALTDIPYGALALLWSDDWFTDGVTRDLHRSAVTGRSHILGMGYISYETNAGDAETGDTISFEIRSPLTRLSEIAAYSKVMLAEASPDDWNEIKTLGVKRGDIQLSQFYTTEQEAGIDRVYHADFSDALYPGHYLQRSDPIGQSRELVDARNAWLVQRERGARFEVQPLPYCRALNDRADLDITLTDEDVYDYDYSVSHFDRIESFELRGITAGASGNTDVYSRSPGSSPGYGKDADTIERVIPDSQANANIICGMRYAFAEQIYIDADGLKQRVGELTLRCPGLYNVLDFTGRFVKFNYANPRWDFNDLRFWLKSYAFEAVAESGEPLTTFVWQAETAAPAGTTYTPPVENVTVAPTSPVAPVPHPPRPSLRRSTRTLFMVSGDGYIYYCGPSLTGTGFDTLAADGGPEWARVNLALALKEYSYDAFCPYGLGSGAEIRAWLTTNTAPYRMTNGQTPGSITLTRGKAMDESDFTFLYTGNLTRTIVSERGAPNRVLIVSAGDASSFTSYTYTTDGVHWANEVVLEAVSAVKNKWPAAYVSPRSNLMIASSDQDLHRSTSATPSFGAAISGLTFTGATADFWKHCGGIHVPFQQTTDDIAYIGGQEAALNVYRVSLVNGTLTDVTPVGSDTRAYAPHFHKGISSSPVNRNVLVVVGYYNLEYVAIFRSLDAGDTWYEMVAPIAYDTINVYHRVEVVDDDTAYFFGTAGHIGICTNLSSASPTIDDRRGNIPTDFPSIGAVVGIWGAD